MFGLIEEEVCVKFGFFFDVFIYGILFYGGIVFGMDCLIMFLIGVLSLCDVIVFLKI